MIVAETETGYRFITQPAHARLAGRFAAHWGDGGSTPTPIPPVVLAAERHDDGWWRYDHRPHLGDDGRPIDFTDVPDDTWIDLYDRGIASVCALDAYAGLLVSLHGTGLRRRRYGLSPSWPDTPRAFAAFVERHEAEQRRLLEKLFDMGGERVSPADRDALSALHETGEPPAGVTSRLWTNYVLLQVWDSLSLALCRTTSPPARSTVGPPAGTTALTTPVSLRGHEDSTITIEPYPFDTDPLVVTVDARWVETSGFETETELAEAYGATERRIERFELRSTE